MKRPFLVAAVAGLAAAYLSIYSDRYIVLLAGIIIMAGYLIFYKHSKTPLFYILFVLIFPVMVIRTEYYSRGMCYQGKLSEDCYAYVKGEAASVTRGDNSYATKLNNALLVPDWQKDDEKGNETVKSGIIIYSQDSFCHAGDYVYVKVKLKDFEEPTNEGQFNTRAYYTSAGINYQGIFNEAVNITSRAGTLKAGLLNMADAIKNVYDNTFTEKNAGTMRAIVLGDRSVLDDEVKEVYKKNGISHILAISAVKTLKLDIPLVPEPRINWAFVPLHIAIIYILKLCLDEEIIPRCRFPCSRGYLIKCINWQKKQSFSVRLILWQKSKNWQKEKMNMAYKKYREMKVYEASGYQYKRTPSIVLKGKWLSDLGFDIGEQIEVKCEDGRLVITKANEIWMTE